MGLLTCVAFMGAPVVIAEKLESGKETPLALRFLQQALASGLYEDESEDGRKGNDRVRVSAQTLATGDQVWLANREDLEKIDISQEANIPLVRTARYVAEIKLGGFP